MISSSHLISATMPNRRGRGCIATSDLGGTRCNGYRFRKQTVEPVFGQIKQARGFRQFLLSGLEAVQGAIPVR